MLARILLFAFVLFAGCAQQSAEVSRPDGRLAVYSIVVSDLASRDANIGRFVGNDVWISPEFGKGDSTFYSWGNSIEIDGDLLESLKAASNTNAPFPAEEIFGSKGCVKEIESFHDLHYYGENMSDVDAKCLIEFWRPGFSADGKRCVIRFYYGPTAHGAVGTYLLRHDGKEWVIVDSTISYYA